MSAVDRGHDPVNAERIFGIDSSHRNVARCAHVRRRCHPALLSRWRRRIGHEATVGQNSREVICYRDIAFAVGSRQRTLKTRQVPVESWVPLLVNGGRPAEGPTHFGSEPRRISARHLEPAAICALHLCGIRPSGRGGTAGNTDSEEDRDHHLRSASTPHERHKLGG